MNEKKLGKIIGIGIGVITVGVGLFKFASDKESSQYRDEWFESASQDELETEREKIRVEFCSSGKNFKLASVLQRLLWKFDDVMSNRKSSDSDDYKSPKHREHGWYLSNDDD